MEEAQKPFACFVKGCEMTFTNEDHLNWHQKKHDMMLNLGLASKSNDVADQTPTPTRFIRNCEEVGLFQDLQNVNPFDDFFKKAVEIVKTTGTLEVPQANSDDTLHTPHILPHIQENQKKNNETSRDDNISQPEFTLNTIVPVSASESESSGKSSTESDLILSNNQIGIENVKEKIKRVLKSKQKEKYLRSNSETVIKVMPVQSPVSRKEESKAKIKKTKNEEQSAVDNTREKIKEMNRAAQTRCRKRKQIQWREMEKEIAFLKAENKKLRSENFSLQAQLAHVKETVLMKNEELSQNAIIGTLVPVSENVRKVNAQSFVNSFAVSPKSPKKSPKTTTSSSMVVQILPNLLPNSAFFVQNTSKIKVKSIQPLASFGSEVSTDSDSVLRNPSKKNLRKIIPKIIIEN